MLYLRRGGLKPSSVARATSAVAAMSLTAPGLVDALVAEARRQAPETRPADAALLACAFAQLRAAEPVAALADSCAQRASSFTSEDLVSVIWAAASARERDGAADGPLCVILDEAVRRGGRLKPKLLSNIVWSLARLRQRQGDTLRALLPHVSLRVRDFKPQGLANSLSALASLRSGGPPAGWLEDDAVCRLAVQSLRRIEDFSLRELVSLAGAAASLSQARVQGGDFAPLLDAVLTEVVANVGRCEPADLASLSWALAQARCRDDEMLGAVFAEAARKAGVMQPREVSVLLRSVGSLRVQACRAAPLLEALAGRLQNAELQPQLPFRDLSALFWAHASLRVWTPPLLGGGFEELAVRRASEGTVREVGIT